MAKGRPKALSPIERAKRRLEEEQNLLQAEEKRFRSLVESAPKKREEIRRQQQEFRHRVAIAADPRAGGRSLRPLVQRSGAAARARGTLKRDRRLARIKFIILCGILAMFLIVLWRSLP